MRMILGISVVAGMFFATQNVNAEITLLEANPADNATVKSLTKISTIWDSDGWLELDEDVTVSVFDSEGTRVSSAYFRENWDDYNAFDLIILTPVTSEGDYTVEIPDNVFLYEENVPVTLHYTVADLGGEDVNFVKANPEAGSSLESISVIELYWDASMDITYDTSVRPYLVDEDDTKVATGKFSQDWNNNGHFTVTFNPAFTEPGKYQLVIPAGCFLDLDYYEPVTSAEVRIDYTVEGSDVPDSLEFVRAYPADKSEVNTLDGIKLYWETGTHVFTLVDGASAAVENADGVRTEYPIVAGEDNDQFIISIDPAIETEGEYAVYVPADIFLNSEGETVSSPAITLSYVIGKPAGVEAVLESGEPAVVYSVDGRPVTRISSPGVYILVYPDGTVKRIIH